MKAELKKRPFTRITLIVLFLLYFGLICIVNFLIPPSYYNSDMYSDIILAEKMWEDKVLFPDDWIFGNQLYVIATPVLSAIFCGLTSDPYLAMGIASTIMTVGIFISFLWMTKPVLPSLETRLFGLIYFVGIILFFGDAAVKLKGWQLFFTMCSYYACYVITAFLAFGCYLRSHQKWDFPLILVLAVTCLFSFATGIQSLRQTMVMTVPLIVFEFLKMAGNLLQRKRPFTRSTGIAFMICGCNIAGLAATGFLHVTQQKIFSSIHFLSPAEILVSASESISNILGLFLNYSAKGILLSGLFLAGNVVIFALLFIRYFKSKRYGAVTLLVLLAFSAGCIWGIDLISTMQVREIYYFMLYPLLAVLIMFLFSEWNGRMKSLLLAALVCLYLVSIPRHMVSLISDIVHREDDIGYKVCDYLEDNGYTIVFGRWDFGDEIAVASKGSLKMQFWGDDFPLSPYNVLREKDIYNDNTGKIAYVIYSDHVLNKATENAAAMNVDLVIEKHFEEENIYICTASENLMALYAESGR